MIRWRARCPHCGWLYSAGRSRGAAVGAMRLHEFETDHEPLVEMRLGAIRHPGGSGTGPLVG